MRVFGVQLVFPPSEPAQSGITLYGFQIQRIKNIFVGFDASSAMLA